MPAVDAYIGLGSNLNNPLQQVEAAVNALQQLPATDVIGISPWYQSQAVLSEELIEAGHSAEQHPDYINGVAQLRTHLDPHVLLDQLQAIELHQGRERNIRWDARTLDLDLLLYGDQIINSARLQVPHPYLAERNFVLYPLADLNADLVLPMGPSLASLLERSNRDGLSLLSA